MLAFISIGAALLYLFSFVFLLFGLLLQYTAVQLLRHRELGLPASFFLVKGLLDQLVYLSTGLSIILAFIGVKLILH